KRGYLLTFSPRRSGQVRRIGDQVRHRFGGVGLGRTNQTHRPALDPSRGVDTRNAFTVAVQHPSGHVRQDVIDRVPRQIVNRLGPVSDRTVDRLYIPGGELAGSGDGAVAVELLAFRA